MSREEELQREIEALNAEVDGFRAQIKPLMKKIDGRVEKLNVLKKALWELRKDDFPALLKESDAWAEMKDYVARRFGVRNGDEAPVAPAGYYPQTGQQAFRIMFLSGTDTAPAAAFIREIMEAASPMKSPRSGVQRWQFEIMTPDHNASGIVSLVSEDKTSFSLVKMRHSYEKPLTGPGTLEAMLGEIRKSYAMDVEQEEADEDKFQGWSR